MKTHCDFKNNCSIVSYFSPQLEDNCFGKEKYLRFSFDCIDSGLTDEINKQFRVFTAYDVADNTINLVDTQNGLDNELRCKRKCVANANCYLAIMRGSNCEMYNSSALRQIVRASTQLKLAQRKING